jgi:hypothetical protein
VAVTAVSACGDCASRARGHGQRDPGGCQCLLRSASHLFSSFLVCREILGSADESSMRNT